MSFKGETYAIIYSSYFNISFLAWKCDEKTSFTSFWIRLGRNLEFWGSGHSVCNISSPPNESNKQLRSASWSLIHSECLLCKMNVCTQDTPVITLTSSSPNVWVPWGGIDCLIMWPLWLAATVVTWLGSHPACSWSLPMTIRSLWWEARG